MICLELWLTKAWLKEGKKKKLWSVERFFSVGAF